MSVLISMLVGSKLSTKSLVERSISSILLNIGTDDFLLVVGISSFIGSEIRKSIESMKSMNNNIVVVTDYCSSFAEFHNYVFLKYGSESKWVIIAHDDIELKTKNLINKIEDSVKDFTDIGWISFTDDGYLQEGHWTPSTREGFHYDFLYENAWERRKLFQFHSLEEDYWKVGKGISYFSGLNYDFPTSIVKCHAPYSHFIAIESEKLRRIGLCEVWSSVSLLIDEDWGLSALREGLINVWIPDIIYAHVRETGGTRAWPIIVREGKQTHELFAKKWGFPHPPAKDGLEKIKSMYGNTNIVWSFDKKSFDWEYLG
ncbi:MAG: hypothetical protein E3J90_14035 [Promethearchaeota archaeon]|nr:MAG: hypothetical protein E3J90_14035 [Candidatus Lokiarchaeota archaeon]